MVDQQTKYKLVGDLIKTPKGREKLGLSFRYPLLNRWGTWGTVLAPRVWPSPPSERGGAYVLTEGELTTTDLPLYHGETKEEETFLQYKTLTAPDVCEAMERAMDTIVKELQAWENERMFSLLRQAPTSVGTGDLSSWLKHITEKKNVARIVGHHRDLVSHEKIVVHFKGLLRCESTYQYDERVPVNFHRSSQGEVWAFEAGSGFSARDLNCEFIAHRADPPSKKPKAFSIKWKANLKLGIPHPGKIHKIKV